jgi:hypothetical protein
MTTNQNDEGQYDEVIAPGAFGDAPKDVPFRQGQNGPVIGVATVRPDGSFTARMNQRPDGVRVEIAGRALLDQGRDAERARWTEKAQHIPGLVHQLTGPEAGMPAEIERWESWHLTYVQQLASELQYLATTAASTIARRDGAL